MTAKNILIVEDMRDWREQLASILRRDGYSVTTAANYGEALGVLRRDEYQLVIVDLRLSPSDENNRDGMILLKDLSDLKIPAIVVTGYSTAEIAREAFRDYGTLDFLEKQDLEIKKLRQSVREAFQKAEATEKELAELRAKFLRGETIKLRSPEDRLGRVLREETEKYDEQKYQRDEP